MRVSLPREMVERVAVEASVLEELVEEMVGG